jgi:hypothetical protein
MADSNEENKVRDIDTPKNLSRKPSDPQASSILSDIGIESKEDKGTEDRNRDVKPPSALPNMFKENGVFSDDLLPLVQHKPPEKTGVLEYWNNGILGKSPI